MNQRTFQTLEYHDILTKISQYALTREGKEAIQSIEPSRNRKQIELWHQEVEEAIAILNVNSHIPIHTLDDLTAMLDQGKKGLYLRPNQFSVFVSFLEHCTKLKRFMEDKDIIAPTIYLYAYSIAELTSLEDMITATIRHGQVDDHASKELSKIRKQMAIKQSRVKEKLDSLAKKYQSWMQESQPILKNGRYTLPMKREYRNRVKGTVIDQSSSGSTIFIEPAEVTSIQEDVHLLKMNEEQEIQQILYTLTAAVLEHEQELRVAIDTMLHYDIIFAKAKYCRNMEGTVPELSDDFSIYLNKARHPLLGEAAVPLTVELDEHSQALLITGPNTGGKTVTLKTVGLLCLMAQSGLLIPTLAGSRLPIFQYVFVDIGDGQSIEENLSTFSSRLVNLLDILREANDHSLLLLDEIGSGTDPGEGMGLAIAILDQLAAKGSTILATTHYSEMKGYAESKEGFMNGAMEFDLETLKPTYRLLQGTSGNSQAFDIAHKLGLHPDILAHAYQITYNRQKEFPVDAAELDDASYKKQTTINRYGRPKIKKKKEGSIRSFNMGDNVKIESEEEMGIVYSGPDERGNYRVQVKGEKRTYNHKRLKLHIAAKDLYPADYDFDIIFKSKEYRKINKQMGKRHIDGMALEDEE